VIKKTVFPSTLTFATVKLTAEKVGIKNLSKRTGDIKVRLYILCKKEPDDFLKGMGML
jgi:hypothetical protein